MPKKRKRFFSLCRHRRNKPLFFHLKDNLYTRNSIYNDAHRYDDIHWWKKNDFAFWTNIFSEISGNNVLELACGTGRLAYSLIREGANYAGLEASSSCADLAKIKLMDFAIKSMNSIKKIPQEGKSSFFSRRKPEDSELDVNKTIKEQFDLMRIADNERYPCFFNFRGHRYKVTLSKIS